MAMTYAQMDRTAAVGFTGINLTGQEVLAFVVATIMALGPLTAYALGLGA